MEGILSVINCVLTLVIAASTAIYVKYSRMLWQETNELRKAQTEPFVCVYFYIDENAPSSVDFVIKNIGNGPAYDVKFEYELDTDDATMKEIFEGNNFLNNGIDFLPQNVGLSQPIPYFMGSDEKKCIFKVTVLSRGAIHSYNNKFNYDVISYMCLLGKLTHTAKMASEMSRMRSQLHDLIGIVAKM